MATVARLFLVTMDRIFGVVKIAHEDLGRLGIGRDKLLYQHHREARECRARHTIFKPRYRRLRRQRGAASR
jgi:hypothetical protein